MLSTSSTFFLWATHLPQFVVHVAHLSLRVDLKQQLLVADQRACCNKIKHEYRAVGVKRGSCGRKDEL